MTDLKRRKILRGIVNGSAVAVALPLLDCFLNGNGTALASGQPMPVRFGTWTWGLGINKAIFVPKQTGRGYELPEEIECLKPIQEHINVLTNYRAYRDSYENFCHWTGWITTRSGQAPSTRQERPGETLDVTIANKVGRNTRFKMLTANATGDVRGSVSYESATSLTPADYSPIKFYQRLFGDGFQDPNAPGFTPDPRVMARKSVLSGVMGDIKALNQGLGAEDRMRVDQYFTGLRGLERQIDQQLTKPQPIAACRVPAPPKSEPGPGLDTDTLAERHRMMTDLMVMALACDQTRVFNMFYGPGSSNATKKGYEKPHHTCTHEEPIDDKLGYQPTVKWFNLRSMENWLYFVQAFLNFKEGDGTLLDNTLIMAHSDQGLARIHGIDGMAMFTAGHAGGKVKSGLHLFSEREAPVTELGYTAMRVMGLELASWGTRSNTASKVIGDILV